MKPRFAAGSASEPAGHGARIGVSILGSLVFALFLPLLPCNVPDCASSRTELLRYSRLPGISVADSRKLRQYANSRDHCSRCFRGRMSLLRWWD
jgi:hypothetical protein